jgi:electron-transferring-flavoprotein dehydrogenase
MDDMDELNPLEKQDAAPEPKPLDADILCTGFGPATGGFLTTLTGFLATEEGMAVESRAFPGMPPQVICYERADDTSFGVSGVVTRARAIKASFPEFSPADVPMAAAVSGERLVFLLDATGAARVPWWMRAAGNAMEALGIAKDSAFEVPYIPPFLHKGDGFILSLGQFNQWVGQQVMMTGMAQVWPASPVAEPLIEGGAVKGIVLAGDGTEVRGELTVIGDGPVGAVSRRIDEAVGMPEGHRRDEWAVGMKFVVDLPDSCDLAEGTVFHTIGFPEPEIFGFFYVHQGRVASVGIFVPSWFESPVRTAYRYLQHYIQHPYLWKHLKGGRLRSWGAKSILESGRHGEPHLCGEGYARIGEGSGSTNVLTGSGVDEAWLTGVQLAEAVIELYKENLPLTKENLQARYVSRRRKSWLEEEAKVAERARSGFQSGLFAGFTGMALAGFSGGKLAWPRPRQDKRPATLEQFYRMRLAPGKVRELRAKCEAETKSLHDALMDAAGWPAIEHDGELLVTQQDALLMGGKVQAPSEAPDHVVVRRPELCHDCQNRLCIEICSGEALRPGESGVPAFDREKCVHCGACMWNCTREIAPGVTNIAFSAGPGGLHSAEN